MKSFIRKLLRSFTSAHSFPFRLEEIESPNDQVIRLFQKSFGAPPPMRPMHFVATHDATGTVSAYVHYAMKEPGLFLIGGLCVDTSVYRKRLDAVQREAVSREGSLSRWLLKSSIEHLENKRAVFGYTGNTYSRRDLIALGFHIAAEPYLFVKWFDEPSATRDSVIDKVKSFGPF